MAVNSHQDDVKPSCWSDENRMTALISTFRPRTVDPVAYDAKLKFWSDYIQTYYSKHNILSSNIEDLRKCCMWNGKVPAGLPLIIDHLKKKNIFIEKPYFFQPVNTSWKAWALSILGKPISWSFNKLKEVTWKSANSEDVELIFMPSVREISSKVAVNLKGNFLSLSNFKNGHCDGNEDKAQIILQYLLTQNQVAVMEVNDTVLIKFKKDNERNVIISELDINIYKLEENEKILAKHIEKLESESKEALEGAKKYVRLNMKTMAKNSLRKKKEITNILEKRLIAQDNLRRIINQIHQTEYDAKIFECYESGVAALKKTIADTGLSEDKVHKTMDDLEDILDVHQEIEATLSRNLDESDDLLLEKELDDLLANDIPSPEPTTVVNDDIELKLQMLGLDDLPAPPSILDKTNLSSPGMLG